MRKNYQIAYILLILVGLTGCVETGLEATDTLVESNIAYLRSPFEDLNLSNDIFSIIAVTPVDENEWDVIVEYSGGCNKHSFYVWWDKEWESAGQERFFLHHHAHENFCEATVRDTLHIEMDLLFDSNVADSTVLLVVNGSNGSDIGIDPELSAITQGKNCNLQAAIGINQCGDGIWGNSWILLEDSVKGLPVWIVPINAGENVISGVSAGEKYLIGISLLFGYESPEVGNSCYYTDKGYAVPAEINCLKQE